MEINTIEKKYHNPVKKISSPENPLLSIITVVYNSEKYIERTIKSIIEQTYQNIEYIIIDGGSKDNTLQIIKKYESSISFLISEPDKGLYDAMNKGIKYATGDYLLFLNSGDQLFNESTISEIFEIKPFADIYYGETIMIDELNNEIGMRRLSTPEKLNWKSLQNGMCVSHQSIIVKKSLVENYNLNYRFSADFEWVLKVLKKTDSISNTKLIISKFLDGGLTKKNIIPGLKERFKIMKDNYGLLKTLFNHGLLGIKFIWYVGRHKRF